MLSLMFINGYHIFLSSHRTPENGVINMHNCSLQNTTKAVSTNKQTHSDDSHSFRGTLWNGETVNQVLVHLLHFSIGAEEEPGRDMSLFSFCWAAAAHYLKFSSIFTACLK